MTNAFNSPNLGFSWLKVLPKQVSDFHTNDDVDSGPKAHHHTLGEGVNQAARGSDLKETKSNLESVTTTVNEHETRLEALESVFSDYSSTGGSITSGTLPGTVHTTNWSATEAIQGITYSGNGRFTIIKAGRYVINARCSFATNATGQRGIVLFKNGAASNISQVQGAANLSNSAGPRFTEEIRLAVNDYVEVAVSQNSGANLTCNNIVLQLRYVGP